MRLSFGRGTWRLPISVTRMHGCVGGAYGCVGGAYAWVYECVCGVWVRVLGCMGARAGRRYEAGLWWGHLAFAHLGDLSQKLERDRPLACYD